MITISSTPPALSQITRALEAEANSTYVAIENILEYAAKLLARASFLVARDSLTSDLCGFLAYYQDQPAVFVSMLWTHTFCRGRGYARLLLKHLFVSNNRLISLSVNRNNPAMRLYESAGFTVDELQGDVCAMTRKPRMAIMQPYLFPYSGYFQLINSVDYFVFYDDVNYITRGWINRNRILLAGEEHLFSVPLSKASQNLRINEVRVNIDEHWLKKFSRTIQCAYSKAPNYARVFEVVMNVVCQQHHSVADLSISSIQAVCRYLDLPFKANRSSHCSPHSIDMERAERLVTITRETGFDTYVNSEGGKHLYEKSQFASDGVDLLFCCGESVPYLQFGHIFRPGLSIIDMLMFCSIEECLANLSCYRLK